MPVILPSMRGLVLDAGCGNGANLFHASERADTIVGIDIGNYLEGNEDHLHKLVKRGFAAFYVDLDNFPYPFKTNCFDTVFCSHVVEHLRKPGSCLDEFFRILKPRGNLILGLPNPTCPFYDPFSTEDHRNIWAPDDFRSLLSSKGFVIKKSYLTCNPIRWKFFISLFSNTFLSRYAFDYWFIVQKP